MPTYEEIRQESHAFQDDLKEWRRKFHRTPELMYEEYETSKFIQETLTNLGVTQFTAGWGVNTRRDRFPGEGGTGIVADIGSGKEPIVLLRADIDALPITEQTDVPFKSQNPGKMHACGHDSHATMLLGAAKILKRLEAAGELPAGTVRLIWQPAEEGGAGAARMVEEGVLDGVSRAFGFHIDPNVPSGHIGGVPGFFLAASDFFEFEIRGKGGHVAEPHLAADPISAAAAVVSALQTIIPRQQDPFEVGVISTTVIEGGEVSNVIPEKVILKGTIRAMTTQTMKLLSKRLQNTAEAISQGYGCSAEKFQFLPDPFPALYNDENVWTFVEKHAADASATGKVEKSGPFLFGDDHAFYSEKVPSAYFFLGVGGESKAHERWGTTHSESANGLPSDVPVHNPKFNLDEGVLHAGSALLTHLALRSLDEMAESSEDDAVNSSLNDQNASSCKGITPCSKDCCNEEL